MSEATEHYRRSKRRDGWRVLGVVVVVFAFVLGAGAFVDLSVSTHNIAASTNAVAQHVANVEQNHAEVLAHLTQLEAEDTAVLEELKSGHLTTQRELAGIESLEKFVAMVQAESAKKNPDVELIESDLQAICADLGHPGCTS